MGYLSNLLNKNTQFLTNESATEPQANILMTQGPGSMMGAGAMDTGMGFTYEGGGFSGFPDMMKGIGGNVTPPQSGMMGGILDTVQQGFDNLDGAMTGAFDTIRNSLQSNYQSSEALIPTGGGGGAQLPMPQLPMPPDFGGGNFGPDNGFHLMPYEGNGFDLMGPQAFNNMMDPASITSRDHEQRNGLGNQFGNQNMQATPRGGIGNATMNPNVSNIMDPGSTGQASLNQDNNQQQSIDDMFASLSGQFNG